MEKLIAFVGIFVMMGIAFLLCPKDKRSSINYRVILVGTGLQFAFAFIILKTQLGKAFFDYANTIINQLLDYTKEGSKFIFGNLVGDMKTFGFIFAFQVLPTIIFFSALMSVMYHLGLMQKIVNVVAKVMAKTMGTSGAESLSAAANIFLGQTEAPLVIKPFVSRMTRSEIMAVMTGGMATVAGGIMASYVGMFRDSFPAIAGHLMAASVMSAPASLVFSKIMQPEVDEPETKGKVEMSDEKTAANVIDAAAAGAGDGLGLALNVAAMLLAFIALIAMFNGIIGWAGALMGFEGLSLQLIMGYFFAPFAFIMGTPMQDCLLVGSLLGEKIILNEFVAYIHMADNIGQLTDTSKVILTYALCGFSNLSSIAIQIGGIGGIAPNKRAELSELGLKAMIAASFACFQTAAIAAMLI
jgi:CNT family concentrative nucleoside transporter